MHPRNNFNFTRPAASVILQLHLTTERAFKLNCSLSLGDQKCLAVQPLTVWSNCHISHTLNPLSHASWNHPAHDWHCNLSNDLLIVPAGIRWCHWFFNSCDILCCPRATAARAHAGMPPRVLTLDPPTTITLPWCISLSPFKCRSPTYILPLATPTLWLLPSPSPPSLSHPSCYPTLSTSLYYIFD